MQVTTSDSKLYDRWKRVCFCIGFSTFSSSIVRVIVLLMSTFILDTVLVHRFLRSNNSEVKSIFPCRVFSLLFTHLFNMR